jgi:hypothetical protein
MKAGAIPELESSVGRVRPDNAGLRGGAEGVAAAGAVERMTGRLHADCGVVVSDVFPLTKGWMSEAERRRGSVGPVRRARDWRYPLLAFTGHGDELRTRRTG